MLHARMSITYSHRLAAQNGPVLALSFERVFNLHPRLASLQAKLHLRLGMIPIYRNCFYFAVHRGKVQVRSAIQVLFDARADRVWIAYRFAAPSRRSAQHGQNRNQAPSNHRIISLFLCDILPRICWIDGLNLDPRGIQIMRTKKAADKMYRECDGVKICALYRLQASLIQFLDGMNRHRFSGVVQNYCEQTTYARTDRGTETI